MLPGVEPYPLPTRERAGAWLPRAKPLNDLLVALRAATASGKCHRCGCFRGTVEQFDGALPVLPEAVRSQLQPVVREGLDRMIPSEYDCLGCAVCWPADALNIAVDGFPDAGISADASCPTAPPERVPGWPPFPGHYRVLDAGGDVAVCVLTSEDLIAPIAKANPGRVALVGAVYTENLGLERIVANVLANPNITTLLLCGADSTQRIGHLPGQSLLSLAANGLDERGRIMGARGRRPVIKNLSREHVEQFRDAIAVVDRVGEARLERILECVAELPPSIPRRDVERAGLAVPRVRARAPQCLVLDPAGYFVVLPDRAHGLIVLEHYLNDGSLAHVFEGDRAEHLFGTVITDGLVTRLDHAAYLGKELALAERALETGERYVQDRAPEPAFSSCVGKHGCPDSSPGIPTRRAF